MAEQRSTTDTYQFPGSPETFVDATPEAPQSEVDLARAAIDRAVNAHEVNSDDIDTHRVEGFGASMVAAAESNSGMQAERYFDPTDPKQLAGVGYHLMRMRTHAMGKQPNLEA